MPPEFDGYYVSNEFPPFDVNPEQIDGALARDLPSIPVAWAELGGASKGLGVRRQRIPVEAVLAYKVWLPTIEEQQAIVRVVGDIAATRSRRTSTIRTIEALTPASVNKAFGVVDC